MTPPTLPPEIEAAIERYAKARAREIIAFATHGVDAKPIPALDDVHAAITSALAAAREAGRREVLEGAAGVETSLLKLAAVAYSQGTHAVRARIGEDGADRDHLRASGDLIVAEQSHRAAIAADKARAVEAERARLWHAVLSDLRNTAGVDAAEGKSPVAEFNALLDGLRPVLSREDAERLVGDFNASPYDGSDDCPARAAILAALTGAGGGS